MKKYEKPIIIIKTAILEDILSVSYTDVNAAFEDVYINEDM